METQQHDEAYWMEVFSSHFDEFMRYARRYFRDKRGAAREEFASDALYLTWWMFRERVRQGTASETMLYQCFYWAKRSARARRMPKDTRTKDVYRALPDRCRQPIEGFVGESMTATRIWDDPAEIAAGRLDMEAWLATLTPEQSKRAMQLAEGWRNRDIADQWGVLPAAVSMQRLALRRSYQQFVG